MAALLNSLGDTILSRATQGQQRNDAETFLKAAKVIVVAVAAIFAALFVCYPGVFTFLLAGTVVLAAHETYRVCENALEILNNVALEVLVRSYQEEMRNQFCKNTLILDLITP